MTFAGAGRSLLNGGGSHRLLSISEATSLEPLDENWAVGSTLPGCDPLSDLALDGFEEMDCRDLEKNNRNQSHKE